MDSNVCKCGRRLKDGEKRCPNCGAKIKRIIKTVGGGTIVVGGGTAAYICRKKLKEGVVWVGKKAAKATKDNWPLIRDTLKQYIPF